MLYFREMAEVYQKAHSQPGGMQIILDLGAMFVGQPFTVYGRADGAQARFWIIDCEGAMSLSAQARLAH